MLIIFSGWGVVGYARVDRFYNIINGIGKNKIELFDGSSLIYVGKLKWSFPSLR